MNSSPFTETSTPADLSARLAEVASIDAEIKALDEQVSRLKKKRDHLEKLCVEDLTTSGIDGIKVAGRTWRVSWEHSMSATAATRDQIIAAAQEFGIDPESITQINTARLKALVKEIAESQGKDVREKWTAGTALGEVAGEYVAPRLRFTTTG